MEDKKREEIDRRDRVMEAEERIIQKKADLAEELAESEDLKEAEKKIEKEEEVEDLEETIAEEVEEEEDQLEQDIEELAEIEVEIEEEKAKGFLGKLKDTFTKKSLSQEKFDELFWELEVAMLENNVAVEVIEKIKEDLKHELTTGKVNRMGLEDMILHRLRESVEELFDVETFDLIKRIKKADKPFKICMIGVNGSGKTTTLAKMIHLFQKEKLTSVVAASDTFRAAAIDQLQEHTDKLGVKLISQGYKADPAAVAYDAVEHAKAQGLDVVLIDTAGRLHSNKNLMAELEKVVRVSKPDLKIFVGEAITGNDCVEQAKVFDELVGIDAIILAKADIDEKGGAAISVSHVTGKPILYLGTGQTYDDLERFDKEKVIEAIGL
ncbi:signal recognition particle-docking protein FtsY [Candidatus Woesearchaeota archaeon]|nr:signal recognition particle-docking protein FtsY [Candidatus Woesearchaeota archaeon]